MARRLLMMIPALAIVTQAIAAPAPRSAAPTDTHWLGGRFLVAAEDIGDPRFDHTLIYMVAHDAAGALGIVVNRPLGDMPLARVLEPLGVDPAGVHGSIRIHYG